MRPLVQRGSRPLAIATLVATASLVGAGIAAAASVGASVATVGVPRPYGYYVLNEAANLRNASKAYVTGLTTSPAYANHVTGHAIFVPIAKILPSISTWGQFTFAWGYLDTLVQTATTHGKAFSIELETGLQNVGTTYLQSLPAGFAGTCGADCAPLFDVWVSGAGGTCSSSYVPLPWNPRVQQFWGLVADSLAGHLHAIGAYGSLTLVHVPGLSVYDEELRLPTGNPAPTPADTLPCPDGRHAYPYAISDADTSRWRTYGYSDSALIAGFASIAQSFALAFPDRVLGLSLFPEGHAGRAFPNFTADTSGEVAGQLVGAVSNIAPGRVQIQADDLDIGDAYAEVTTFAPEYGTAIGWQSNKHNGTGATCANDTCGPDGFDSPYFQLLQTGAAARGHYVEVWSHDVVTYPQSFTEADSAGYYSLAGVVPPGVPARSRAFVRVSPDPARGTARVRYTIASGERVDELDIVDVSGQRVWSRPLGGSAGSGEVAWDGRTLGGRAAPGGVYYALLRSGRTPLARSGFVLLR